MAAVTNPADNPDHDEHQQYRQHVATSLSLSLGFPAGLAWRPDARKFLTSPVSGAGPVHDTVHGTAPLERLVITLCYRKDWSGQELTCWPEAVAPPGTEDWEAVAGLAARRGFAVVLRGRVRPPGQPGRTVRRLGIANVAGALPVTPGGLEAVDSITPLLLVGFGVTRSVATLGVLGWRMVNFWLPIPTGALAFVSLKVKPDLRMTAIHSGLSSLLTFSKPQGATPVGAGGPGTWCARWAT